MCESFNHLKDSATLYDSFNLDKFQNIEFEDYEAQTSVLMGHLKSIEGD